MKTDCKKVNKQLSNCKKVNKQLKKPNGKEVNKQLTYKNLKKVNKMWSKQIADKWKQISKQTADKLQKSKQAAEKSRLQKT